MDNNKQSFFDSKTILAIGLVVITWSVWNNYMQNKYPEVYKKTEQVKEVAADTADTNTDKQEVKTPKTQPVLKPDAIVKTDDGSTQLAAEELVSVDNEYFSLDVSTHGMGFKNITLKKYKDREMNLKTIGTTDEYSIFETRFKGQPQAIVFEISTSDSNTITGVAMVQGMTVTKEITINPEGL